MKTPATLTAYHSRRDIYGNCYWAFLYQDHETGRDVSGTITGGESNIRQILYELNGKKHGSAARFQVRELPIRQFNRLTKGWPYAGCVPEELAAFILGRLSPAQPLTATGGTV